jgi:hypothetical protein
MSDLEIVKIASRWPYLVVRGKPEQIDSFLETFGSDFPEGWKRDHAIEARVLRADSVPQGGRCYSYTNAAGKPTVAIWLFRIAPDCLKGGQTLPLDRAPFVDYLNLVVEFLTKIFTPAVELAGLEIEEVNDKLDTTSSTFDRFVSPEALNKLQTFIDRLPRQATRPRPEDRRNWNDFVIAVHESDDQFEPEMLHDWLRANGVSDELINELLQEFRLTRSALRRYDEARNVVWR